MKFRTLLSLSLLFASAAHASTAAPSPLTASQIREYARQLGSRITYRQGCGEGDAFEGSDARLSHDRRHFVSARNAAQLGTIAQLFARHVAAFESAMQANFIAADAITRQVNAILQANVATRSGIVDVEEASAQLKRLLATAQSQMYLASRTVEQGEGPYLELEAAQVALTDLSNGFNQFLHAERTLARSSECSDAENAIGRLVQRISSAQPPEAASITDTFQGHAIRLGEGRCRTLDQFSGALGFVLQLAEGESAAITEGLTVDQRAVLTQLVADYVRRYGDSRGVLTGAERARLNTLVTALQGRFIGRVAPAA